MPTLSQSLPPKKENRESDGYLNMVSNYDQVIAYVICEILEGDVF